MTAEPSDVSLAIRFRDAGDTKAFEALVLRHLGPLRRFLAVCLPGDPEAAADAEQEVLVRLHRALGRWAGRGGFTTYLFTLARRVAIDEVRRRIRDRRKAQRYGLWSRPQEEQRQADSDPQIGWGQEEEGQALLRALATLPEPDRTLIYLKDAEGMEVAELAQVYRMNEGTVKSKLSRGRTKLRQLLQEEHYA